ncbi:hypothetical protein AGMMS50249_6710 [candidate division SR1 bacterium]|nr:hypothetical protein AGMMS50249_6710 [candidate division SR1 bacterium]
MELIKPSVEIIDQEHGLQGVYRQIERIARICRKSEDKITEDSAENFVKTLIQKGETAMLEHGTVYLEFPDSQVYESRMERYQKNYYSRVNDSNIRLVTTNYRVIIENSWADDLVYICENRHETTCHESRISVKFICDRGASHELVRHRAFSFAQESSRFSLDMKNNPLKFIIPVWLSHVLPEGTYSFDDIQSFSSSKVQAYLDLLLFADQVYRKLRKEEIIHVEDAGMHKEGYVEIIKGWTLQEVRSVLPTSIKTELVMTGFLSDWIGGNRGGNNEKWGFLPLRNDKKAHPQVLELAIMVEKLFKERGLL